MKKVFISLLSIILILGLLPTNSANAQSLANRLKGKLLLQVEQGGRIWYVNPEDSKRYEVTFANALPLFENFALGISNNDLDKIPLHNDNWTSSIGNRLKGKLLLQVEQGGRIWYIDFNSKRWEVTWANLMTLFESLALGITDEDLNKIPTGDLNDHKEQEDKQGGEQQVIEDIILTGSSVKATNMFILEKGLSIFNMTHSGNSNFIVYILDSDGETVDYIANEIGVFEGKAAVEIEIKGNYLLNVTADSNWEINIEQPRNLAGTHTPLTINGQGRDVKTFSVNKGLAIFNMTHNGSSNFIIELLNSEGSVEDYLVNEIGIFEGSTAVNIPETGVYLLNINADGGWEVSIE